MSEIERIPNCHNCKKPTEDHEWLDGLPGKGLTSLAAKKVRRFKCSKCGHEMSSFLLPKEALMGWRKK